MAGVGWGWYPSVWHDSRKKTVKGKGFYVIGQRTKKDAIGICDIRVVCTGGRNVTAVATMEVNVGLSQKTKSKTSNVTQVYHTWIYTRRIINQDTSDATHTDTRHAMVTAQNQPCCPWPPTHGYPTFHTGSSPCPEPLALGLLCWLSWRCDSATSIPASESGFCRRGM